MLKRFCNEPLLAKPAVEPKSLDPFSGDPPKEADQDAVAQQRAAADRAASNSEWLIWGSGVFGPGYATDYMTGRMVRFDDRGIIARARRAAHAQRIAECVNACTGINDPEKVVAEVRDLLLDMVSGSADINDIRIASLLGRMSNEEKS